MPENGIWDIIRRLKVNLRVRGSNRSHTASISVARQGVSKPATSLNRCRAMA